MRFHVMFGGVLGVLGGVDLMAVGQVSVMRGAEMIVGLMVFGGFGMMMGCQAVMMGCLAVMMRCLLRHFPFILRRADDCDSRAFLHHLFRSLAADYRSVNRG